MNSILKNWKMRVVNQTKLESEKTRVYAQKPWLKWRFMIRIFQNNKNRICDYSGFCECRQNLTMEKKKNNF